MPSTRTKNADTHPGAVVQSKRRSTSEVKLAREEAEAKKQQKLRKKEDGINRIASLENEMALDDAKAKKTPARRLLHKMRLLTDGENTRHSDDETGSQYEPTMTPDGEASSEEDLANDQQPKKKPKVKAKVRSAIEAARKATAAARKATSGSQSELEEAGAQEDGIDEMKVCGSLS
jgi:hypothetical protein